ncbi:MAG: helix-hairpin-helix domain-containing protein [Gemmataceae bacterium]|nr:helix-hairpin-helix domain-containing protein [Gemmataceae bacterium]MCI0739612.1 helix-hairpin-helix domain-containing protein [Gemmataceae bacterium]
MHPITPQECSRIAQDLQIRKVQVESVVKLLDEGNTIPFLARYRKELTGGLPEDILRQIQARAQFLRQLADRKQTILKSIEGQGKLNDELRQAILKSDTIKRLEDLYLPFKPKKRTPAAKAREQGLEPAALAIWHSDPAMANLDELLPALVNAEKELKTPDEVRAGVQAILAEMISETAAVRAATRMALWETGKIVSAKNDKLPEGQGLEFKEYFNFSDSARQIQPHRILALSRGEREHVLKVRLDYSTDIVKEQALRALAEHLFHEVGKMPPPSPAAVAPPAESPAVPVDPGSPAATETPPEPATLARSASEGLLTAPTESTATPATSEPAAIPPASEPPPENPTALEAAAVSPDNPVQHLTEAPPLAATLPVPPLPPLTGEPLIAGSDFKSPHAALLRTILEDALQRLIVPSLEKEIRRELTEEAETHAFAVHARNLRRMLLQPPLRNTRVLAIDPSVRAGCKIAVLDELGALLDSAVIHLHSPGKKSKEKQVKPAAPSKSEGATAPATVGVANPPPESATSEQLSPAASANVVENRPEDTAATPCSETTSVSAATESVAGTTAPQVAAPTESQESATAKEAPSAQSATPEPAAATVPGAAPSTPPVETAAVATPAPTVEAPPVDRRAEAKSKLKDLVAKHRIQVIAIGNGNGCKELEDLVVGLIGTDCPDLCYAIVQEAGASVYGVSQVGREEFPEQDAGLRASIFIGRRLQDPLSELVKIEPHHLLTAVHQHDHGRKELKELLDAAVESCVNLVGVNINTASVPVLRHVSGLNQMVARDLAAQRQKHGAFASRAALQQVPTLAPARYMQAAGFVHIPDAANPLDRAWIHPESYGIAEGVLTDVGLTPASIVDSSSELASKLKGLSTEELAKKHNVAPAAIQDLLDALAAPGHDPRAELPLPILKKKVLQIDDLKPGMELKGTVLNVVDFGAFVDVGMKDSGLVHISQMANRYIKSPYDVVAVHEVVTVWVLSVDREKQRVSLTMIQPGTERKPLERGQPHAPRGDRPPPRGRREGPPPRQEGRPPPRGRSHDRRGPVGPPQRTPSPAPAGAGQTPSGAPVVTQGEASSGSGKSSGPPPRPQPPRRRRREPPKPKLTQEALEGKVALRSFSELGAFFAARKEPDQKQSPPASEAKPAPTTEATTPVAAQPQAAADETSTASPPLPPTGPAETSG